MACKEFINYNGRLLPKDQAILNIDNRSFRYGDGLFESMHMANNQIQFFEQHMQRLTKSMNVIGMEIPKKFSTKHNILEAEINTLNNKNLYFKGTRIRLTVFRESGGLYTPETNSVSYAIESKSIDYKEYTLNRQGLLMGVYDEQLKPINLFSFIKSANSLFFVLAGIYKKDNNLDECLILNTKGDVIESISSNVFLVKNKKIYTPPLKGGCLPGIMRHNVIELAKNINLEVECDKTLKIKDFEEADEVFLTNAAKGIQWVMGFGQRRYYNHTAKKILEALNYQQFYSKEQY